MLAIERKVRVIEGLCPTSLTDDILESTQPLLLRGLVAEWPMVRASRESDAAASAYILSFYRGEIVVAGLGRPDADGRLFYNEDLTGFNFQPVHAKLNDVMAQMAMHADDEKPPTIYVGSTAIDVCLPGFDEENKLDLGGRDALASIWIGNRSRIAAHYDTPDNLACVVTGRRRFTLFPPDQIGNLYIGPLDLTPAGQPISLVDFKNPDFSKFPKFAEALKHAQVAEMEPGDALFIPNTWWHHVEALERFNVLVNYWWRQTPSYVDTPINALMLAIMTVRDLPPVQRKAWETIFRHYVFEADADTASHIPAHARRSLGPIDDQMTREMRAQLVRRLNR